jgi:hypothetical protein
LNTRTKLPGAAKAPTHIASLGRKERPSRRSRSKFLVRYILSSDEHEFVGRIYDLSIVAYHFDSYEALAEHPDCKYVIDVDHYLSTMTQRVESLNMAGDLLWPEVLPTKLPGLPVSAYQWLTVAADVFLMRYISVVDCALILSNAVYECGLDVRKCSLGNLRKRGVPAAVCATMEAMLIDQSDLRAERNARFHHGVERDFTEDDQTFRIADLLLHQTGGVSGTDRFGRKINVEKFLKEGLVELQREFNQATRRLVRQLDRLYDALGSEFEARFGPRIRTSIHGLRVSRKR